MASGLTHILLTKKLQDEIPDGILKNILAFGADSFLVGAVAPDLPYASIADDDFFFSNESPLADNFHYRKTNQIPLRSLKKLESLKGKINLNSHYHMFSFFLGYISHVFADGIIHPFVRDKVGDYSENQAEHRSLEMQLDVLFMEELTRGSGLSSELNYTNIHDGLGDFVNYASAEMIIEVFSELIYDTYAERYSAEKIFGWINGLERMFEVAEGDNPRIYRNLKANTFSYRNREDINRELAVILQRPKDRSINFLHVDQIDFFKDCIPQFYSKFIKVAQKAQKYVFEGGTKLSKDDIPLIDLDTGRLLANNKLDLIPVFWKK